MKNLFLVISICLFTSFLSLAGGGGGGGLGTPNPAPPACAQNPAAGNTCLTATPICDLNGYCGSTSSTYTANSWSGLSGPFCGSIENNSFLIFTASATTLVFNVWLTSSSEGDGIQIMVFRPSGNCSGSITQYMTCWSPGDANAGPEVLTATGLTPGENYYIMIDGYAGDVCDYVIGVESGAEIPVDIASSISAANVCLGDPIDLSASGGNGSYTWDPVPGLSATTGQNVSITPTTAGTYNFTVHSATGSTLCPSANTASIAIDVINCDCDISATNTGPVCPGGSVSFTSSVLPGPVVSAYNWTGPNGFTASGQNLSAITAPTTPGSYDYTVTATVPTGSCSYTTTLVVKPQPVVNTVSSSEVCPGFSISATPLSSTPSGATFNWTNNNPNMGIPATGTGNIPGFTSANSTSSVINATVSITPTLDGCVGPVTDVLISINPQPTVNAIPSITVCAGQSVGPISFTGNVPNTTYSWSNTNTIIGLGASGSGNIPTFTGTNTTSNPVSGTVTVTPSFSICFGTATTIPITINPLPNVGAGVDQTICSGTSTFVNGSGAATYVWNQGVTNGVNFTPTATQTYTVTGTDANGCTNTDQVLVTVNATPQLVMPANQAVCIGDPITLTASGADTYTWTGGITNGVAFTPNTTTTYDLTGANNNGCTSTGSVTVTVNPLPIIQAGNDIIVCEGTSVTLSPSPTTGITYVWNNGAQSNTPMNLAIGNYTYTVVGTDVNGCQNSDQLNVTVNDSPETNAGLDQTVCVGTSVVLVGTGADNYAWSNGVVNNSSFTPQTTTTYTLTGTNNNGCFTTDQVIVTVNPLPNINAGLDRNICDNDQVTLTATGGVTYAWSNGGQNGQSLTPPIGATTFTVTGTDANGCVNSDQVTITVFATPISAFTGDPMTGYPGLVTLLTNTSQNASIFNWDLGNGATSTSQNSMGIYTSPGTYTVILSASNGICSDESTADVIVMPWPDAIIHVPNVFTPNNDGSNDVFFLDVQFGETILVQVFNRWGDLMSEINDFSKSWDGKSNGNDASEGVYFFKYRITDHNKKEYTGHGPVTLLRK